MRCAHNKQLAALQQMFGFGSLINAKSRLSSDPNALCAIPVRIHEDVGFERCWNFQHPLAHLTALGLRRVRAGQKGRSINGVCTPIVASAGKKDAQLPQEVLDREVGYTPVPIESKHVTALSWLRLPKDSFVWIFVPNGVGEDARPGEGLSMASRSHPILQSYVDVCVLGCLDYGRAFAVEFIRTTIGWDRPWLNDRKVPRRPWLHTPRYKEVDTLLQETIPELLKNRMLPTEFAVHFLDGHDSCEQDSVTPHKTDDTREATTSTTFTRVKSIEVNY